MNNQKKKFPVQAVRLSILGLLIIVFIGYKFLSKEMLESKIDKLFAGTPKGMITYKDASFNLFTQAVKIYDFKIKIPSREPIVIEEVKINSIDMEDQTPQYMDVELDGIVANLQTLSRVNPMAAGIIKELGYDELKSNIHIDYQFNKEKKMLNIKEMSWKLKNAGKLTYKAKLYDVNSLAGLLMQIQLVPQSLKVGKIAIEYKDRSLANRVIKLLAQHEGKSTDAYKKELIQNLSMRLKIAQKTHDTVNEDLDKALIRFLKDPDEFKIGISPKEPISIGALQNAQNKKELFAKLNFKVSGD